MIQAKKSSVKTKRNAPTKAAAEVGAMYMRPLPEGERRRGTPKAAVLKRVEVFPVIAD